MNNSFQLLLQLLKDIYIVLLAIEASGERHAAVRPKPLLNKLEVIARLRISDTTYRRYVKKGILTPMTLHGIDMYYEQDIEEALQESKRKGRL
ncbi:hypothetical protein [Sphingobacterium sp. SYP-B4668]|uniref:hypothetical protein n=1 Tax=Sphingobacterium sp. SYP-B4668 TaxID=2996035 RepID=UPI0022DE2E28|nr:hypothetical protein [Sphingobacterium sp. SYP-B4668]